jgi:hypothetical protein
MSVTNSQRCLECSCVPPVKVSIRYTNYTSHSEDVYIRHVQTIHQKCKLILLSLTTNNQYQVISDGYSEKIQLNK